VITALMVKDPDRRMPLDEVRLRLRPLIDDPDDPTYPGSPDAPTMEAVVVPHRPRPVAAPRPPTADPRRSQAPLADSPGPVPVPPRRSAPSGTVRAGPVPVLARGRGASGWVAVLLVVAGAAVVLLGAAAGWAATRAIGGQSPLTTLNVTTAGSRTLPYRDELGFTVLVPVGWTPYRTEPTQGEQSVVFVSPDGTEELAVKHSGSVADARAVPGAEIVDPAAAVPSAAPGTQQLTYRTADRTSWRRILPAANGFWTVTLTVPRDAAGSRSAELFEVLANGFAGP